MLLIAIFHLIIQTNLYEYYHNKKRGNELNPESYNLLKFQRKKRPLNYILSRRSIRTYSGYIFTNEELETLHKITDSTKGLFQPNKMQSRWVNCKEDQNASKWLGIFRFRIKPDYLLIPAITGEKSPLLDFGYRMEQIAVNFWRFGAGTCFIGSLHQENEIINAFNFSKDARVPAFLVFGKPKNSINTLISTRNRKPINDLVINLQSAKKLLDLTPYRQLVEAGQSAPSAVNFQPWRFQVNKNEIMILSEPANSRLRLTPNADYALHDVGLCIANIDMAAEVLGLNGKWFFEDFENDEYRDTTSHIIGCFQFS